MTVLMTPRDARAMERIRQCGYTKREGDDTRDACVPSL